MINKSQQEFYLVINCLSNNGLIYVKKVLLS